MNGHSDILIIGGGIAGMTAALYAARANLSVRIVEKEVCGGLVNWCKGSETFGFCKPSGDKKH